MSSRLLLPGLFSILTLVGCPQPKPNTTLVSAVTYDDGALGLAVTLGDHDHEIALFPWPGAQLSTQERGSLILSSGAGAQATSVPAMFVTPTGGDTRFLLGNCKLSNPELEKGLEGLLVLPSGAVFPLPSSTTEVEFARWEGTAPSGKRFTYMTWALGESSSQLLFLGEVAPPTSFGKTGLPSWPVKDAPKKRTARLKGEAVDLVEIELDSEEGTGAVRNRENAAILFRLQRVQSGAWSLAKPEGVAPVVSQR